MTMSMRLPMVPVKIMHHARNVPFLLLMLVCTMQRGAQMGGVAAFAPTALSTHRPALLDATRLFGQRTRRSSNTGGGGRTSTSSDRGRGNNTQRQNPNKRSKKSSGDGGGGGGGTVTLKELMQEMQSNPDAFGIGTEQPKKSAQKRTRKRVAEPKQRYVYAAQRRKMAMNGESAPKAKTESNNDKESGGPGIPNKVDEFSPLVQARKLGLVNPSSQHCDTRVEAVEPEIVATIQIAEGSTSASFAYIIEKPVGWSILGGGNNSNKKKNNDKNSEKDNDESSTVMDGMTEDIEMDVAVDTSTDITNNEGADALANPFELDPFSDADILAAMTPEEQQEYLQEIASGAFGNGGADDEGLYSAGLFNEDLTDYDELLALMSPEERQLYLEESKGADTGKKGHKSSAAFAGGRDMDDVPDFGEDDLLAAMTPEEIEEFNAEGGFQSMEPLKQRKKKSNKNTSTPASTENAVPTKPKPTNPKASFGEYSRPSIVSWLKDHKAEEGTPIRGGKFWTALAGATGVDDSGLVLLCPKEKISTVHVDFCKYVAVLGNGEFLAPKPKALEDVPRDSIQMEILSKLRKGRLGDNVLTIGMAIVDMASNCNHVVQACQNQLQEGVRGDPSGNPFDRRAPRRLVHCDAMSVSSLGFDDDAEAESEFLPDDIAILADRRNNHDYVDGSFLGRAELNDNPYTTAYREMNGAADGFVGWTVDRYDQWLLVQHDDRHPKGPVPSIHDGNTAGVYYLPANPNRGAMGRNDVRPVLSEGKEAPEMVPVQENGVTYLVSLDQDLSTGIFLDQRPQRAWLTRNCNEQTRVLNCFAHCGAFSVAAASAGAATVSLDLSKKWLDRIEPQMELNGVDFANHDCIYGDCE